MSRIGNTPVAIPSGVTVTVTPSSMSAKGPKGQLTRALPSHVEVTVDSDKVIVKRVNDSKPARARHGLTRALLQNLVTGVSEGYTKSLEIIGVGYRAQSKGKVLELSLGFSHPINYAVPDGIQIKVEKTVIHVTGIDKELVGQTAADIRRYRQPDAYKGKGVRYLGEHIRLKAGKAGSVGA
jgi:large subunit ribosomal protein L6